MQRQTRDKLLIVTVSALALALLLVTNTACHSFWPGADGAQPAAQPLPTSYTGDTVTHFTQLAADDIEAYDDLIVVDDATVSGDLSAAGVLTVNPAPAAGSGGDLLDITDSFGIADGSDAMVGIDLNLTGANHTGSGNTLYGLDLDLQLSDANCTEAAIDLTDTDWDYGIQSALDQENLLIPSVRYSNVITTSNGALWTIGATEVWYIDRVICNVTTNFDCTGDDCTIEIGLTGGDIDGFLDLDDGELQTTDAEIAGLTAGWQGFGSTDTRGAFFAAGAGVILSNDTIDIKIEDNSDQSDPTAGAATCYLFYTRLQ
jgi:hypothetical protein